MVQRSDKFMCDGGGGYNYMGRDLHGRLTVSLSTCHGELAKVDVR